MVFAYFQRKRNIGIALSQEKPSMRRGDAIQALGHGSATPEVIQALAEVAKREDDERRRDAISALGSLGNPDSLRVILRLAVAAVTSDFRVFEEAFRQLSANWQTLQSIAAEAMPALTQIAREVLGLRWYGPSVHRERIDDFRRLRELAAEVSPRHPVIGQLDEELSEWRKRQIPNLVKVVLESDWLPEADSALKEIAKMDTAEARAALVKIRQQPLRELRDSYQAGGGQEYVDLSETIYYSTSSSHLGDELKGEELARWEAARQATAGQQAAADVAPPVTNSELSAQEWYERGIKANDPEEKIRFYSEAIRLKPDYAYAFNNRGTGRQVQGDLEGALRDYNEAIRLKPDDANAFYNRGIVHQGQGDLEGALKDYNEAIRLKPDDANAFYNRGNVFREQNDLKGAIKDYSEAIRLKPDYAAAFYNRGDVRRNQNDLEGALNDYDEAIRLKPDYAAALNDRGNTRLFQQGDLQGALKDYDEAIRLKPTYANAFSNRGLARYALGDLEGALKDSSEAIRLKPDAAYFTCRGIVRKDQGDLEGALKDYNEAIRLKPDYAAAFDNRALVFEEKGDYEAALTDYQKYLDCGGSVRDGDQADVEQKIRDLRKKLEASQTKIKSVAN